MPSLCALLPACSASYANMFATMAYVSPVAVNWLNYIVLICIKWFVLSGAIISAAV